MTEKLDRFKRKYNTYRRRQELGMLKKFYIIISHSRAFSLIYTKTLAGGPDIQPLHKLYFYSLIYEANKTASDGWWYTQVTNT